MEIYIRCSPNRNQGRAYLVENAVGILMKFIDTVKKEVMNFNIYG
jgi:hypothetical protein